MSVDSVSQGPRSPGGRKPETKERTLGATLRVFENGEDFSTTIAAEIAQSLNDGLAKRGSASLVAAGGTTPGDLYDALSEQDVDWARVSVTLSDERWSTSFADKTTEKLVLSRLIRNRAAPARFIPLRNSHVSPKSGEAFAAVAIGSMPRPFDVVLLGMGQDGHTASLYPHTDGLETALDLSSPALVRAVATPNTERLGERISLTARAILDSRRIIVLLRGNAKLDAYRWAASAPDPIEAPIRTVLFQSQVPVEVCWAP